MESHQRPDRYQLAEAAGFGQDDLNYGRLVAHASIPTWVCPQFEKKTGRVVPDVQFKLLADIGMIGALMDDGTDTGGVPSYQEDYESAFLPDDLAIPSNQKWLTIPPQLQSSFQAHASELSRGHQRIVSFAWNSILDAMYDHKLAAVEGRGLPAVIVTRIGEAVALADLFCATMDEEFRPQSSFQPEDLRQFSDWLSLQLSAGNVIDSVVDYEEDLTKGHVPLSASERRLLKLTATTLSINYLRHPLTDWQDVRFMSKGFREIYLGQVIKNMGKATTYLASRLAHPTGT